MADADAAAWYDRLAERSPSVQRSRTRSIEQARVLIDAAHRLIAKGETFTTHELIKEAGVALQTFYRYFGGKDELLLAVLEDMISSAASGYAARVADLDDPVERLHRYVDYVVHALDDDNATSRRFVASEHWRLAQLYPDEVAQATQATANLFEREIVAANETGQLRSADPARDAWLLNQLLLSVFHHHSFTAHPDPTLADDLWRFALRALGDATA